MGLTGDAAAGVFLSQLIYWTRRTPELVERDGWIFKTAADWQRETGMSWKVQSRARQLLIAGGWIEERKLCMPARLEYRLHLPALSQALGQGSDMQTGPVLDWSTATDRTNPSFERLLGRSFLFHGVLTETVPLTAAVLASRLETRPQAESELDRQMPYWWRMSRRDWTVETGLTRDQWQTARKHLVRLGVLVERGHNFPRRVDLALDPAAMAAWLADCRTLAKARAREAFATLLNHQQASESGKPRYRQEREKQVGGFGQYPNQPSLLQNGSPVSPNPACTDRPILPATIARSNAYPNTPLPLTTTHHHSAHALSAAVDFRTPRWGGGGTLSLQALKVSYGQGWAVASTASGTTTPDGVKVDLGDSRGIAQTHPASHPTPSSGLPANAVALCSEAELAWPRALERMPEDIGIAKRHLAGLDSVTQQAVLDEVAYLDRKGTVRSHVGLVRTLANKARDGKFQPEGAHRVARERSEQRARAEQLRQERERQAAMTPVSTQAGSASTGGGDSDLAAEARARLKASRDALNLKRFG